MSQMLSRSNPLAIVARLFRSVFGTSQKDNYKAEATPQDRLAVYDHVWNYYLNSVYTRSLYGGSLDYINELLGEAAAKDLAGLYNPVELGTEIYAQNIFAGNFGDEITVAETVGSKRKSRPVNPRILDPLEQIDEWSNMNSEKDRFARYTALFGTCGIRVVAKVGKDYPNDPVEDRRVYLQFEHPGVIDDYETDSRGNITQILTIHRIQEGELKLREEDADRKTHVYKMLMTKTAFTTLKDDQLYNNVTDKPEDNDTFGTYPNLLGFVPYVNAFFRKHEGKWGAWWFVGSEEPFDRINAVLSHIARQVFRHVNVTWMVTSGGEPPEEFDFSGNRILFIRRKMQELAAGTEIEPLIANLSLDGALNLAKLLIGLQEAKRPEITALSAELQSGQSGQSIAQNKQPLEDNIKAARANMESSLVRARKMALSYGILLGLWDVGTGLGDIAANRAFKSGLLDHRFNSRRALSITAVEELELKQLELDVKESEKVQTASGTRRALPEIETGVNDDEAI